jgi:predicted DNA-binding helix-hairpin-helix protein
MLDLTVDPKLAWALKQPRRLSRSMSTRADREMLLRVPGMGVKAVDRIDRVRRYRADPRGRARCRGGRQARGPS